MSLRLNTHGLSVDELLERAAPEANLAMLREHIEPSRFQIDVITWATSLLDSELESIPLDDFPTRAKVLAQLDINQSILAPVRRLPVELLSYIFSLVVRESPLRTINIAVTFSRICTAWRRVARAHAALWTTVVVENLNNFDDYCELFLPLTKTMPLELRCDDRTILGDLWDCMTPYASRWRRITLVAGLTMLPELQVLYMENLERLVVDAYDASMSVNRSVLDFVVAPHLRHLAFTLDALQSERQLHVPVARTLTSLDITTESPFPVTHTLPLLRACAESLQSLTLKIRYPSDGPEGSSLVSASDAFDMTALVDLRLNNSACALLRRITAPLIEWIVLSNVPEYGTRSLLGFLTRSQASRYLFDFRVYQPAERDISSWLPCLQLMHSLRDLHFDELLSNADFLRLLVRRPDKPTILPSLKNIAIWNIFCKHEELKLLIREVCKSRARMTTIRGQRAAVVLGWIED